MRILGVIPARLGSTRLPNKPLQLLAGEPLVTRVIQRVTEHGMVHTIVVATDSPMVARVVERAGVQAIMTSPEHASGTERVAEVASRPEFAEYDIIANVQGDEPFIDRAALAGAIDRVRAGDDVGTAAAPLDLAQAADPSRVKVVTDINGRALYFSRAVIPFRREPSDPTDGIYWQHIGLYVYSREVLERWVRFPMTAAEQVERLEQLRGLQHGLSFGVARLTEPALPGVDTPEDLQRAEAYWNAQSR
ncbi:MAG: 3-deoxy-manno-octulosonate cytidylyltransferase [Gemmatimonadota bacterium]